MAFTLAHRKQEEPTSEWVFEITGLSIAIANGRYKKGPNYGEMYHDDFDNVDYPVRMVVCK